MTTPQALINQSLHSLNSLNGLKCAAFWKDMDLFYQGCNDGMCAIAKFSDPEEVIGTRDEDNYWRDYAESYQADDYHVLTTKTTLIKPDEVLSSEGDVLNGFSLKAPLFYGEKLLGLFGLTLFSSLSDLQSGIRSLQTISECLGDIFAFGPSRSALSIRESDCVRYLLAGYRPKEIATYLNLSARTVESYLLHARHKLDCHSTAQLRIAALKRGYTPKFFTEDH